MDDEELAFEQQQRLEHELHLAARFLLAYETLPQAWARLSNLALAIDYPEIPEPF